MATDTKTLVFDDVAKHNKIDDCWLIISGKVYDVTPFMDDHPGGGEVMRKATGKDATVDYSDVGHSTKANEMMQTYYVGEFDQSTIPEKRSYLSSTTEKIYNLNKSPQFILKRVNEKVLHSRKQGATELVAHRYGRVFRLTDVKTSKN